MPARAYRIGILETAAADAARIALWDVFKQHLQERGFVEGNTISFEFRWAEGRQEALADLATELVRQKVDAIVTAGTPAVTAASGATADIPIVMATGTLPTHSARNIVGVVDAPPGISAKRLQLLVEAVPGASSLGILADDGNPSSPPAVQETMAAAESIGTTVRDYWICGPDDLRTVIATMKRDGVAGFVIAPGALFFAQRRLIADLAVEHRLPSMAARSDYADAGVLVAYGAPIRANYRQAATYVDRILRGAQPSALPAYEPAEFDLVVNLRTAKAIGLALPPTLLAKARTIGP